MEDAIADPEAAVAMSVDMIDAAGNQNFLTKEGEMFRWQAELAEVLEGHAGGRAGRADRSGAVRRRVRGLRRRRRVARRRPRGHEPFDADLAAGLYGADGKVIWPA